MKEVFDLSFAPQNLLPTILLLFAVMYWVVFLLGFLDLSFLDIDLGGKDIGGKDLSLDAAQGDVHAGGHVDSDAGGKGFGGSFLSFLNLTHVPFMVVFSFFALFFWAAAVIGNHYFAGTDTWLILLTLVVAVVVGLVLAKVSTQPLRGIFRKLNNVEGRIDLRGKTCVLEIGVEGQRIGQADVVIGAKHLLINVKAIDGVRIARGTKCLIVDLVEGSEDTYLVEVLDED